MKKKDVSMELLESIKELGEVMRGERKPSRVINVEPIHVKEIRRKLRLSQAQFARMMQISPATLKNWEQGRTYPEGPARALLMIAAKRPDAVLDALHAA